VDTPLRGRHPWSSGAPGADRIVSPNVLDCDDDQLAICLDGVASEFNECEADCSASYPDDNPGYQTCRNECRDTEAIGHEGCYDTWCTSADQSPANLPLTTDPQGANASSGS